MSSLAQFPEGGMTCPKCSGVLAPAYHDGRQSRYSCAAVTTLGTSFPGEHLCWTCDRCHFKTATSTRDARSQS